MVRAEEREPIEVEVVAHPQEMLGEGEVNKMGKLEKKHYQLYKKELEKRIKALSKFRMVIFQSEKARLKRDLASVNRKLKSMR